MRRITIATTDRYLAGRNQPAIAYAELSRVTGSLIVQALFAHHAHGGPCRGDYIGAALPDTPRGAVRGVWSTRTTDEAETLLTRIGWRVTTVDDARRLLTQYRFVLRPYDPAEAERCVYLDEDGDGRWRAPRHGRTDLNLSALVVPA